MSSPWLRAGALAAAILVLDQLTKAIVRRDIEPGEHKRLTSFLDLVHVRNDGVAFGQFAGSGAIVVVVVAIAMGALIYYFARHVGRPWVWLPTGMLLAGAIGNIIDRVRLGSVTDFVKFPSFPAFNVADSAITVGVLILIVVIDRAPDRDGG
ncbi:MAG TPA: signal peptidase II [Baekduia sp.]|nr:signal peptidase II [Baekduia sp.]